MFITDSLDLRKGGRRDAKPLTGELVLVAPETVSSVELPMALGSNSTISPNMRSSSACCRTRRDIAVPPSLELVVLAKHADPPRCVAADHQRFAVCLGIMVRLSVTQHRMDHPELLVCRRNDRPLVVTTDHQCSVAAAKQTDVGELGAMGEFDEHRAERFAALADLLCLVPFGALAIARTQAGP